MGQTALHLAILHKVSLNDLLRPRRGVNIQDKQGRTPLNLLLTTTHLDGPSAEGIQLLIETGADVNLPNKAGYTSFHLILDREYSDKSPLIYSTIQLFLNNGADTSNCCRNGQTPLEIFLARSQGAWAASKPGHAFCEQAHACLFTFIHRCAEIDALGPSGELLAHEYLQKCSRLLLDGKAMITRFASKAALDKRGRKGNYLIHELLRLVDENDCSTIVGDLLRVLLNRGGDPNIQNALGQSPAMALMSMEAIHWAGLVEGAEKLLRIVVEHGGSVWIRDSTGRLPIYKAMLNFVERNRYGMAKILLFTDDRGVSSSHSNRTDVSGQDSSWWQAWGLATVSDDWKKHENLLNTAKASLPDDVRNILYPIMMRLLAESYLERARDKFSTKQVSMREHRNYVATVMTGMFKIKVPFAYPLIGRLLELVQDD
jgi:ankyrin repeat protein